MYPPQDQPPVRKIPVRAANTRQEQKTVAAATWQQASPSKTAEVRQQMTEANNEERKQPAAGEVDWQALALRQQAEMENFRRRQLRRAEEATDIERERLLRLILPVADNLSRALQYDGQPHNNLHEGVALTQRELARLLAAEGVTKIDTEGQPFDPNWHEAVATVPGQAPPNTIVEEIEAGYMLGDKLLRPARVVVAA